MTVSIGVLIALAAGIWLVSRVSSQVEELRDEVKELKSEQRAAKEPTKPS